MAQIIAYIKKNVYLCAINIRYIIDTFGQALKVKNTFNQKDGTPVKAFRFFCFKRFRNPAQNNPHEEENQRRDNTITISIKEQTEDPIT